ncbi:TetR/AcrR family transcriptional regulator C-terminal domain-containing protein [Streptosporangium sp. NPDC051022]|uniref:TetR/AcrR family transcriptional regulator n=1 Tax=Streptosporangium sp. NPDC051022 TaxID=3155752 RepID=UPI00341E6442
MSRRLVVEAAVTVLDTGEPLTMTAVADRLGARQMSIYNYVRGKRDLLAAVEEHLLGTLDLPEPDAGADGLAELCRAYWRLLRAHPWLVGIGLAREGANPAQLRIVEAAYAVLFRLGVPPHESVPLVTALVNLVVGTALQQAVPYDLREPDIRAATLAEIAALPPAEFPALHRLGAELPRTTPEDAIELGLAALLGRLRPPAAENGP